MLSNACKNTATAYYRFTRVVFYYNKNQGEFIFGPVFLVRKKLLPD